MQSFRDAWCIGLKDWKGRCSIFYCDIGIKILFNSFRQEKGKAITLFFDMDGCGLSNMDMEFIQYLIGLCKLYYPFFLNYIIVFEMAWILNGKSSINY